MIKWKRTRTILALTMALRSVRAIVVRSLCASPLCAAVSLSVHLRPTTGATEPPSIRCEVK